MYYAQTINIIDYIIKCYKEPLIISDEDLVGVELPHNDTTIITLNVSRVGIKWIFIDMGICYNITMFSALKQMGFDIQILDTIA